MLKLDQPGWEEMGRPQVEVLLDGTPQKYPIMADEKNGIVEVLHPTLELNSAGDEVVRLIKKGKVEVIFKEINVK